MSKAFKNKVKLNDTVDVVADYGADPTGVTDSWQAITNAIATNKKVIFQGGTYLISKPLEASYFNLEGAGWGSSLTPSTAQTIIKKTTNALGTTPAVDGISYAVDSIISVVHPTGSFSNGVELKGISFQGISNVSRNAYVMYAPKIAQFKMDTVGFAFGVYGFYSGSAWDALLSHVQASNCTTGWKIYNGVGSTSWAANNVSSNFCNVGFDIFNLQYSTFNSCYAESCSTNSWLFTSSKNVVLNGCGGEHPTGSLLSLNSSAIQLNGWQSGPITGINAVEAISVVDSTLTIISSIFQDFSAVNGAKNMTITGSGSASEVKVINSTLPISGSASTVDGFSTYFTDTVANHANVRGKTSLLCYAYDRLDTTTVKILANGVFSTTSVPTYNFKQINNTVFFTITLTCTVSGAGAGTLILETGIATTSIAGTAISTSAAGSVVTPITSYAGTQIRMDMVMLASTTSISIQGQINL